MNRIHADTFKVSRLQWPCDSIFEEKCIIWDPPTGCTTFRGSFRNFNSKDLKKFPIYVQALVVTVSISTCIFPKVCAIYTLTVLTWRDLDYRKQESTCARHFGEGARKSRFRNIQTSRRTTFVSHFAPEAAIECAGTMHEEWPSSKKMTLPTPDPIRVHLRAMRELQKRRKMKILGKSKILPESLHKPPQNSFGDSYSRTKSTLESLTLHY